jgi:precorrin-2 dehydrogenase/sirohydrochlorin ferrochelatase
VHAHDQPNASHFALPALVRRGALRIAISTSEAAPALAARIRADLTALFDDTFVAYLDQLGELRARLRTEEPDAERRSEALRAAVADFRLQGILRYR